VTTETPQQRLAAALTEACDSRDRLAVVLADCRGVGVRVLVPDVNTSTWSFTPVGDGIRWGFIGVRGIGPGVADVIVSARTSKGAFTDFYDFLDKVNPVVRNLRTMLALTKSGAFDSLGYTREGVRDLVAVNLEDPAARALTKSGAFGSLGYTFEDVRDLVAVNVEDPAARAAVGYEWSRSDLLAFEREALGAYVSGHPLDGMDGRLGEFMDGELVTMIRNDVTVPSGSIVRVAGVLTDVCRRITRYGRAWASATLEDRTASVEALVLPSVYERQGQYLAEGEVVGVTGRVYRDGGSPSLLVTGLQPVPAAPEPVL
jgi:DNA polymerase III subunit alpha